jgi:16S rRNA (guanine966-N2)-methyltransferase
MGQMATISELAGQPGDVVIADVVVRSNGYWGDSAETHAVGASVEGAEARALLRNNVEALGLGGVTKVYRRDATDLGPVHPMEPFSLVFLDPPYRMKLAEKALASLRDGGWLTSGARLVVEEAKAAEFAAPEGFEALERRAYDDTEFVFLRAVAQS